MKRDLDVGNVVSMAAAICAVTAILGVPVIVVLSSIVSWAFGL